METPLQRNRAEFQRPPQGEFRARAARKSDDTTEKVQPANGGGSKAKCSRSTTSALVLARAARNLSRSPHRGRNRTLRDSMSVPQLVFLPRAVIAGNAAIFSP